MRGTGNNEEGYTPDRIENKIQPEINSCRN